MQCTLPVLIVLFQLSLSLVSSGVWQATQSLKDDDQATRVCVLMKVFCATRENGQRERARVCRWHARSPVTVCVSVEHYFSGNLICVPPEPVNFLRPHWSHSHLDRSQHTYTYSLCSLPSSVSVLFVPLHYCGSVVLISLSHCLGTPTLGNVVTSCVCTVKHAHTPVYIPNAMKVSLFF